MKTMKLSAIMLGLAAASAFAQAAPAAAPAATPAAAPATQPAAQPAAAPAAQPAAEAPKAETAQPATQQAAAPAADTAAVAPKAEEAKVAEEPKKDEAAKAEEPKIEEKKEEVAKAEEPKAEEKKEDAKEGASFIERLNITKADPAPEGKKAMEFKVSGQAEFDTYVNWRNDNERDFYHDFWSTVDVDFQVKFNDKWSAQVEIEADGEGTSPAVHYNGAFVQYQRNENFAIKFGDMTYSEGAFDYYDYNDPADYAVGMKEHDVRGIELDLYGLQLAFGLTRSGADYTCSNQYYDANGNPIPADKACKSYDVHAAYQFDLAGQALRPFVHYQNWQIEDESEFHAGLEAALEFGPFAIHAVYGLHADRLTEDDPKATHAFLAEPTFKIANVNIKGGFFYALLDDKAPTVHDTELPEYMFAYGEGDIKFTDALTIGAVGELHTNSLDDDTDLGTLNFGLRSYFTPVDGLEVTGFAMAILPMGNDWEKAGHAASVSTKDYGEDLNLYFGVETVFSF